MRDARYYINQLLINIALWCLSRVDFKNATNRKLLRDRSGSVKHLRQCI